MMPVPKVRNIGESQSAGFGQIMKKEVPQAKLVFPFVVRGHPRQVGLILDTICFVMQDVSNLQV